MRRRLCAAFLFVIMVKAAANANCGMQPTLRMEFHVQKTDLSYVMEVFTRYAEREGLSIEDIGPSLPPRSNRTVFYAVLRRQDFNEIKVTNFIRRDQMLLIFYCSKQAADSEQIGDALIAELREKWPDIHVCAGT